MPLLRQCLLTRNIRSLYIYNRYNHHVNIKRTLSSNTQTKTTTKVNLRKEKGKLRTYVAGRYMEYVQNYTKALDKKFPAAMNMYRIFTIGIKDFYNDLKSYMSLSMKINREGFRNVSRQDIELYHKMPIDMWRIAPVLILSAVPFGNYVIFPLAMLKPRKLLCSHFWSIQQRAEFSIIELQERLKYNKPVFRCLQSKLVILSENEVKLKWMKVIAQLGSGVHPLTEEITNCSELFTTGPYSLENISYKHAGYLLKMHGLRKGIFRKKKLRYRALILKEMDRAIIREGGVDKLSTDSLKNACYIRGLNSQHLSNQDMMAWLQQWLQISQVVDKKTYSLLLHSPVFLAYNNPQNWMLIY